MSDSNFIFEDGGNFNRIRVESCIGTILAIKSKIQNIKNLDPKFLFQFNKLETMIPKIKVDSVTESEVEKIENATNNLLEQMKYFFTTKEEAQVYEGTKH